MVLQVVCRVWKGGLEANPAHFSLPPPPRRQTLPSISSSSSTREARLGRLVGLLLAVEAGLVLDRHGLDGEEASNALASTPRGANVPDSVELAVSEGLEIARERGAARDGVLGVVQEDHLVEHDELVLAVLAQLGALAPGAALVVARAVLVRSSPPVQLEDLTVQEAHSLNLSDTTNEIVGVVSRGLLGSGSGNGVWNGLWPWRPRPALVVVVVVVGDIDDIPPAVHCEAFLHL